MAFPPGFLEQLRSRVDLAGLVGKRVALKRQGKSLVGLCPFHDERTPSFHIVEEKGFYHCFGCGAHGDAISFVMHTEGLEFPQAVKSLASLAGLSLPEESRSQAPGEGEIMKVLALAQAFYEKALFSQRQGQAYLEARGISQETMRAWHLGFAPPGPRALESVFPDYGKNPWLETAGLVQQGKSGKHDRFRSRVMFPILAESGKAVAFGARTVAGQEPKYLNSPETPVFVKSQHLFGLPQNKDFLLREKRALVVEGYMDVLALVEHGVRPVVATMGTSIRSAQIERLLRFGKVIFCFDGDAAGRNAAFRALKEAFLAVDERVPVFFAFLPEGEDPDSFIRKRGADAVQELLAKPLGLCDFFLEHFGKMAEAGVEAKAQALAQARAMLKSARSPVLGKVLWKEVSQRLASGRSFASSVPPRLSSPSFWRRLAALLVLFPRFADDLDPSLLPEDDGQARAVLLLLSKIKTFSTGDQGEDGREALLLWLENASDTQALGFSRIELHLLKEVDGEEEFAFSLQKLKAWRLKKRWRELSQKPFSSLDAEDRLRLREMSCQIGRYAPMS